MGLFASGIAPAPDIQGRQNFRPRTPALGQGFATCYKANQQNSSPPFNRPPLVVRRMNVQSGAATHVARTFIPNRVRTGRDAL